jgi:hypothetical protein
MGKNQPIVRDSANPAALWYWWSILQWSFQLL